MSDSNAKTMVTGCRPVCRTFLPSGGAERVLGNERPGQLEQRSLAVNTSDSVTAASSHPVPVIASWLSAITRAPALRVSEVREHDDGHFRHAEFARCEKSPMARDQDLVGSHQYRIGPSECANGRCDLGDLLVAVRSRIGDARDQP